MSNSDQEYVPVPMLDEETNKMMQFNLQKHGAQLMSDELFMNHES